MARKGGGPVHRRAGLHEQGHEHRCHRDRQNQEQPHLQKQGSSCVCQIRKKCEATIRPSTAMAKEHFYRKHFTRVCRSKFLQHRHNEATRPVIRVESTLLCCVVPLSLMTLTKRLLASSLSAVACVMRWITAHVDGRSMRI